MSTSKFNSVSNIYAYFIPSCGVILINDTTAFHVTLRSLDGLDAIKERKVFLSLDEPVMIGRSSKTATKNLTPAANNTWIDSPIVSREHALLSVALGRAGVNVKSLGMHGTYLNGDELDKNKDSKLETGAILQLGSSISRGDGRSGIPRSRACALTQS